MGPSQKNGPRNKFNNWGEANKNINKQSTRSHDTKTVLE